MNQVLLMKEKKECWKINSTFLLLMWTGAWKKAECGKVKFSLANKIQATDAISGVV